MQLWANIFASKNNNNDNNNNKQENYNSAHKMVENFRKFWVLLVYLNRLSHIID